MRTWWPYTIGGCTRWCICRINHFKLLKSLLVSACFKASLMQSYRLGKQHFDLEMRMLLKKDFMRASRNGWGRGGEVIKAWAECCFPAQNSSVQWFVSGLVVNVDCLTSILLLQQSQMLQPDFFKGTGKTSGGSNLIPWAVHHDAAWWQYLNWLLVLQWESKLCSFPSG